MKASPKPRIVTFWNDGIYSFWLWWIWGKIRTHPYLRQCGTTSPMIRGIPNSGNARDVGETHPQTPW